MPIKVLICEGKPISTSITLPITETIKSVNLCVGFMQYPPVHTYVKQS